MRFHSRFPDVAPSAHLLASADKFFAGTNRQEYKLGSGTGLHQHVDCINAVHSRHRDVNYNNVRVEALNLRYKEYTVGCYAHDFKVRQQQGDFGFQEFVVVIGQKYARANQVRLRPKRTRELATVTRAAMVQN